MSSLAVAVRASGVPRETRRVLPLVIPVSGFALALVSVAAARIQLDTTLVYALFFLALATLAEIFPAPVGRITGQTSLSIIALVPAAIFIGWEYATIAALLSVLLAEAVRRKELVKAVYNGSMFALAAGAAGWVAERFEGTGVIGVDGREPAILASSAYYAVNISLLMAVIALSSGSVVGTVKTYLKTTLPQFAILGSLAALFVELWSDRPWLVVLMVGPIVVIVAHQRFMFRMVERMRELDLEKDDFISYASHELRTPITVISGAAKTIRQRTLDAPTKEQLDDLIYDNADRLSQMTNQLLDLNRLNRIEPNPQPVHLGEYLENLVRRLGLAGRVAINANGATIATDPELLDRVVGNLVTNAANYGEDPISVTAVENAIIVEDRGDGVPEEFRERMFKRFTRASLTANNRAHGAGLGLALAVAYAEVLGGTITYEDVEPSGARFIVTLP